MRRREFITLLSGAAASWPLTARAQQQSLPVVGILSAQSQQSEAALLAEWEKALNDAGYASRRNVLFEYRFADGQGDRLPMMAADLVQRQVSVLVANTTPPALAAKAATTTIPIVFVTGVDPVEVGLVASFNRPGANVTGVTFLSNKLVAKRLELLAALISPAAPIGMLAHTNDPNTIADVRDALAAAAVLGRTLYVERSRARVNSTPPLLIWSNSGSRRYLSLRRRIFAIGSSKSWQWRSAMLCQQVFRTVISSSPEA